MVRSVYSGIATTTAVAMCQPFSLPIGGAELRA
jgi:hypothetical protein